MRMTELKVIVVVIKSIIYVEIKFDIMFLVCQSWGRRGEVVFEDPCSSTRRQTAGFEKSTAEPRCD